MAKEKQPAVPHRCDICGSEQGVQVEYYSGVQIDTVTTGRNQQNPVYDQYEHHEGGCCNSCEMKYRIKNLLLMLGGMLFGAFFCFISIMALKQGISGIGGIFALIMVPCGGITAIVCLIMAIAAPFLKLKDEAVADYYNKKVNKEAKAAKANGEQSAAPVRAYFSKSDYNKQQKLTDKYYEIKNKGKAQTPLDAAQENKPEQMPAATQNETEKGENHE